MATIDDFVTVNISTISQTPTQVGFGTPMIYGYHTAFGDLVRTYTKLQDLVADGITSTGVGAGIYWQASKIFSQNPRVKQLKVGKRTNAFTQILVLTPTSAVAGDRYTLDFGPLGGTLTTLTRTVPGASTIAAECTAIKALIDGLALGVTTSTPGSANVTVTANVPGALFNVKNRSANLTLGDTTAAPAAISTDLSTLSTTDPDWYGLVLDSNSKAEIVAAAAWVETQLKVLAYHTADSACGSSGSTTDVMASLQTSNYFRTFGLFDGSELDSGGGAAWIGEEFPFAPGSGTYALKNLKAVTVDSTLTPTTEGVIKGKNGNTYTRVAGFNLTNPGKTAAGEYIDIAIGRDCLATRLKERVFGALASVRKVPFTDAGVDIITTQVRAVLQDFIDVGFLAASPAPIVTAPKVADVSVANKANRLLPDVSFSATLAGAIQATVIGGTISV